MSGSFVRCCELIATAFRCSSWLSHAAVALLLSTLSAAVFAQGVTGTVSGTVKDAQAGVVPGATVTLINEAQGTQTIPVVTNASGDFVVPNVPANTYTVQVEMASFRTLKLSGIAVSPGARVVLPPMTIEVGGASEQLVVTAEAPMIQAASGEKSFTVATESVNSDRVAVPGQSVSARGPEASRGDLGQRVVPVCRESLSIVPHRNRLARLYRDCGRTDG